VSTAIVPHVLIDQLKRLLNVAEELERCTRERDEALATGARLQRERDAAVMAQGGLRHDLDVARRGLDEEEAARNTAANARQELKAENVDLRQQLSDLRATLGRLAEGAS
jgi:chromosome segregation ATPase